MLVTWEVHADQIVGACKLCEGYMLGDPPSWRWGHSIPMEREYPPPLNISPEVLVKVHIMKVASRNMDLPGLITWQACQRLPISDSPSHLSQAPQEDHCCRAFCRRMSLSGGNRNTPATISTSIPRNVMQWLGRSNLSVAKCAPSSLQFLIVRHRAWPHTPDFDGPIMMKSLT